MAGEFTLDAPATSGPAPGGEFTLEAPPPEKPAAPSPTMMDKVNDKVNLAGTAITNAGLGLVGLPGTASRVYEAGEKTPLEPSKNSIPAGIGRGGDVGAGLEASEAFHALVGKHLPSGEEIKDWFWGPTGVGGRLGIPRREPKPDSIGEKVAAGAIEGAATSVVPGMGGQKVLSAIGGGLGSFAEKLFPDHPHLANFLTQVLTFTGGGALVKSVKEAPAVMKEAIGGSAEDRAATALVRSSGLSKDELATKLDNPTEVIPGSKPTTAQVVDTPGMTAVESQVRKDPLAAKQFGERDVEQQTARSTAADTVAPIGDVTAPRDYLQNTKEVIEKQVQTLEKTAAQEIETRLAALGPDATPEQAGKVIREVTEKHYSEANDAVDRAYKTVIEPGRAEKIGIDSKPAVTRMDKVLRERYGRMNPAPNDIRALRDRVENDGKALTYKDMLDARAAATKLADKYAGSSHDQAAVLSMRDILDQRMSASASSVLKLPETLQRFSKADEATTTAERLIRLNELRDIEGKPPIKRWGESREKLENRITAQEKGMREDFGAGGAMNPDEYQRFLQARELRKQTAEKYERGAIDDTLARGNEVGNTKLTNSEVPARFWHSTQSSAKEDIDQFVNVLGGNAKATEALRDYAVGNLRALAEKKGGLTDAILNKYLADHKAALDSPIGAPIRDELKNLQTAREAIASDIEQNAKLLSDYQASGARHFLSERGNVKDPDLAIKSALAPGNRTGKQDMLELHQLAKVGGPDVEEGLKALIRDDFVKSTGGMANADSAAKWLAANREKVTPILGKAHMDNIEAIVADMSRGKHPAAGSQMSLARLLSDAKAGGTTIFEAPWTKIVPGGSAVANFIKDRLVGAKDTERVADLFNEAMLNPEIAKKLVTNVTRNTDAGLGAFLENTWKAIKNRTSHDSGVFTTIKGPLKVGTTTNIEHSGDQNGK